MDAAAKHPFDTTAFILAGGKSSRMGRDKAFVEFRGRTLLERAIDLAAAITPHVRVVGSKQRFAEFAPVVEDVFANCGPLGGIHAALQSSANDLNLILAVDTPFVTDSFLRFLLAQARKRSNADAIVPRGDEGYQPLCAIYRRSFVATAEKALRSGRYKINPLFEQVRAWVIEKQELRSAGFSEEIFRNLNTPEELEAGISGPTAQH
jgi:molybdopterin-guanine dinucleotide biosynthesis protein A